MDTTWGSEPAPAPAIDLSLAGPRRQRRLTVAFRWILAIPHFLYLLVLFIATFFAVIGGWFAALVTGRLPGGIHVFVARVLNHATRVYGYAEYLLTDRYPPFALDDEDHDVAVLVPPPLRLNRAAVLFRVFLQIPAMIVLQLLSGGVTIVMFFAWIVVLVTGRLPGSLWHAMAAILRYQTRAWGYVLLLTSEYPRGLFGERTETAATTAVGDTAVGDTVDDDTVDDDTAHGAPTMGSAEPRITRLVLGKAAKRIVVLVLVLGVLSLVGTQTAATIAGNQADRAREELEDAYDDLDAATLDFIAQSQTCAISGGPECLQEEVATFAGALEDFLDELDDIEMPQGALPYARDVEVHGSFMLDDLDAMANASSEDEYLQHAATFQEHGANFDEAFARLYDILRFS